MRSRCSSGTRRRRSSSCCSIGGTELGARLAADRARRADLLHRLDRRRPPDRADRGARGSGSSLLELGGNNAIIVDESADLDLATRAIVFGALGTAGQRCTSTRRVFVHRSRLAELQRRLVHAYQQVRIGDPLDPATLVGPLIDRAGGASASSRRLAAARAAGGQQLLVGGTRAAGRRPLRRAGDRRWRATTGTIVQQETFGPILYLIAVDSLEQAIELQNASRLRSCPRACSPSASRMPSCYLSHRGSDCGIANVNIGTSGAEIGGAFGGEKDTGGGREAGSDAWKAYMRRQTNTINWSAALPLAQGIEFDLAP